MIAAHANNPFRSANLVILFLYSATMFFVIVLSEYNTRRHGVKIANKFRHEPAFAHGSQAFALID
jgi:heme/copper-type cytochrome/quinol oxidase subunit 3